MTAGDQSPALGAAEVYRGFIEAVNRQDLEAAGRFVDAARYRENCVGFTPGLPVRPRPDARKRHQQGPQITPAAGPSSRASAGCQTPAA
jgi:xylose isomerase